MKKNHKYIHGRGAQINPPNPFEKLKITNNGLLWIEDIEERNQIKTEHLETHPKTILNKVESPDIGMGYSLNPYQGCEHGCIYCYARNTHTFWGYSSGLEFEQKILIKKNAPQLLEQKLRSKSWKVTPIMLSGNTDCYQPAEKKFQITREILKILWKLRHPVGIITKSSMILRDLDLLRNMAKKDLVHVAISVTTLQDTLRQKLEPRTATGIKRIQTIKVLSQNGIPVNVMFAPIIPSINDQEVYDIARLTSEAGALGFHYTIVRLNGDIADIFKDWLLKNYPNRYERVVQQISDCHGGQLKDSRFGTRMRGEGNFAEIIHQQVNQVRKKYFSGKTMPPYNTDLYPQFRDGQYTLF